MKSWELPHRFRAKLLDPEEIPFEPVPIPDPFQDVEALEALEERIIFLAAHIHAAIYRFLVLVADFDRRQGWKLGGHRTCAHWLHAVTGFALGTCREKIRVARALANLPLISASMAKGELAFCKARAVTRVADPENEADLLQVAKDATTAQLESYVRSLRKSERVSEAAQERSNHRHRRFRIWPDEAGMYVVEGRVTPEVGALLMRAIEAGIDASFSGEAKEETTPVQRRADALGLVAERALAAGFGEASEQGEAETGEADAEPESEDVSYGTSATDSTIPTPDSAESSPPATSTRAERYQVFLHVDVETLEKHGEGEKCHLEDGVRVSPGTCRRLTCDCSLVKVVRNQEGDVLNVGRRTRSIPPAIRRALEVRDQGCRWPGCGLRFTAAHHIDHWVDGGETSLRNLISLCHFHHRKVHEDGWDVVYNPKDNTAVFWSPAGEVRAHRPPMLGVKPEVVARAGRGGGGGGARKGGTRDGATGDGATGNGTAGAVIEGTKPAKASPDSAAEPDDRPADDASATNLELVQRLIAQNRRQGVDPKGPICSARGFWREKHPWEVGDMDG